MSQKIRAFAVVLLSLAGAAPLLAGPAHPYRETGAEIAVAQTAAERLQGPRPAPPRFAARRRPLASPAGSPVAAGRSTAASGSGSVALPAPREPQSLGVSFLGASLADSSSFPPDTMGAVGPTQFLVGINGRLRTFDKTTGQLDGGLDAGSDVFFAAIRNGAPTFSLRVRYDRLSGVWIVTALTFGISLDDNRVLIAASEGATISLATTWTFSYFEHDLDAPAGDAGLFFDVGTLGVDANALVIGGNLFDGQRGAFTGTSVHVVRKSEVVSGGGGDLTASSSVVAYRNLTGTPDGTGPYTPQGVDNLADAAAAESWAIGVNNVLPVTSELVLRQITYSAPGAWPPAGISGNLVLDVPTTALPLSVPHLGNTGGTDGQLDAIDDRLGDAKLRGGHIWTAHNIAVDSTGAGSDSGDRDGARWYEIDVTGGAPALVQSGTLFDSAANPRFYWMPSIMVSGQGHAAIGSSAAGSNEHANAVTSGRLSGDPAGTLQSPSLFTSSTAAYNPAADPGGPRRWGDYSYTSLDPDDDMTLWTIQEYCSSTDSWGVRVAELKAPAPAIPASATPAAIAPGQASVSVVVTGSSVAGSGFFDPGPDYAKRLSASVSGSGVTVNSATVTGPTSLTLDLDTVGAAPGPRTVTVTNPDGQSRTSTEAILTITSSPAGPSVEGIAPGSGDAAAANPVVLTGSGFVDGASVAIGGLPASDVAVTGAASAAATTPILSPGTLDDVTLVDPDTTSGTLYGGWLADFLDVPQSDPFHAYVEKIFRNHVTAGCTGGSFCRDDAVTRAQMAVFLLKSRLGAAHVPPVCTGVFQDVACPSLFADWIEELYTLRVTGGCNTSPLQYCPGARVTRAQMAVFLLKASLGSSYAPPNCSGAVFLDVPCTGGTFDPWIEDLAGRGITRGCGGGDYCPDAANTRGQMAVFLVKTFGLP